MVTTASLQPEFRSALGLCVGALRRVVDYRLDPSLDRRLNELGERKEFLTAEEHEELLALVSFARQRTIEKLEAENALRRLNEVCPEAASVP